MSVVALTNDPRIPLARPRRAAPAIRPTANGVRSLLESWQDGRSEVVTLAGPYADFSSLARAARALSFSAAAASTNHRRWPFEGRTACAGNRMG